MPHYRFEVYDFAHYSAENHAKMDEMAAAGYTILSCAPNFAECSVLWEHPDPPGTVKGEPAPGLVGSPEDAQAADEVRHALGEEKRPHHSPTSSGRARQRNQELRGTVK